MESASSHTFYVISLIFLFLLSAFFSASETSLSSCNKIRLKHMARAGDKKAEGILKLIDNFDSVLSTILVGNNIVNIAAASIATVFFIQLLGSAGLTVSTLFTTVIVLIFGEISPKSLAKEHPEAFLLKTYRILTLLTRIFTPVNWVLEKIKKMVGHALVGKSLKRPGISEDELKVMVDEVEKEGTISQDESDLIKSAIEFNDIRVKEILTPRVDMVTCNITNSNAEIFRIFSSNSFSRIPVYDADEDNIIGIIHTKDFYSAYLRNPRFKLKKILKHTTYVHRSTKVSLVLKNMQRSKNQMAVVIDSYGGVAGIVTIEDILEELVGEIWDEYDTAVSVFHKLGDRRYLVSCDSNSRNASLRDMFEYLQLDFDLYNLENQPISGWVVDSLEKIPAKGDSFVYRNLKVIVYKTQQNRVLEIMVEVLPDKEKKEES